LSFGPSFAACYLDLHALPDLRSTYDLKDSRVVLLGYSGASAMAPVAGRVVANGAAARAALLPQSPRVSCLSCEGDDTSSVDAVDCMEYDQASEFGQARKVKRSVDSPAAGPQAAAQQLISLRKRSRDEGSDDGSQVCLQPQMRLPAFSRRLQVLKLHNQRSRQRIRPLLGGSSSSSSSSSTAAAQVMTGSAELSTATATARLSATEALSQYIISHTADISQPAPPSSPPAEQGQQQPPLEEEEEEDTGSAASLFQEWRVVANRMARRRSLMGAAVAGAAEAELMRRAFKVCVSVQVIKRCGACFAG